MLKNAYLHLSETLAIVAFLMFFTSQGAVGGGMDWGDWGDDGCSVEPDSQLPSEPLGPAPVLIDQLGKFKNPVRIAMSRSSDIYITDHEKGVVAIFDATGKGIGTLKGFTSPLGLAVYDPPEPSVPAPPEYCSEGVKLAKEQKKECKWWKTQPEIEPPPPLQPIIYVGDDGNGSVKIFNGEDVSVLGSGSGEFIKPNGIAVTEGQTVYVVDSEAHQVKAYDDLGALQFSFGSQGCGDGELDFPIDIVLNELLGEVYVSDFWNKRIVVFDLAGNWLRNIFTPLNDGGDPAYSRPSGLGIDPDGNLYVVDNVLSCVAIITNTGTLINIIGYSNEQYWTGDLALPLDAATDGLLIYVISSQERIVKIFDGVLP